MFKLTGVHCQQASIMDSQPLEQGLDSDIILCLSNWGAISRLRQLLALSLNTPVKVVSNLEALCWRQYEPHQRLLLTDYQQYRHHLQDAPCHRQMLQSRILVIDAPQDEEKALCLLYAGVAGIIPAGAPVETLLKATRALQDGELWFPRNVISHYVADNQKQRLEEPRPLIQSG